MKLFSYRFLCLILAKIQIFFQIIIVRIYSSVKPLHSYMKIEKEGCFFLFLAFFLHYFCLSKNFPCSWFFSLERWALSNLLLVSFALSEPYLAWPKLSRFIKGSRVRTDWKCDNLPFHKERVKISKIRLCNRSLSKASLIFFIRSIFTILFTAFDRCWDQPLKIVPLHIFLVRCYQVLFVQLKN